MIKKVNQKNGDELSILGFGCMRLPSRGGMIDEPRAISLIRNAIDKGVNYLDTAYIYHGGKSESLLGKALADGYREKVKIATKLPTYLVNSLEGAKKIIDTQFSRLRTDTIDYYLMHMLTDLAMFEKMKSLGVMDYVEELKRNGSIKNIGFSFHGDKNDFEDIIKAYHWDFCQIQYNYLDENRQATRTGLMLASSLGIPVIIMEPLRGGRLVNSLPKEVLNAFRKYDPDRSPAEWGLRWLWNHREINVVLSGMSDEAQVEENIKIAGSASEDSLTEKELEIFEEVKRIINGKTKVPCTACGYCMPCPYGVNIPGCFSSYNDRYLLNDRKSRWQYIQNLGALSAQTAFASQCRECGKCEKHCPQNIEIRKELKNVSREMEGPLLRPALKVARKVLRIKKQEK